MKGLFVLFVLVGSDPHNLNYLPASLHFGLAASRWKRNLFQFDNMVTCVTGRDALSDYNGYGCWCGYGGYGDPKDLTDQCCQDHDMCYRALEDSGVCSSWDLYFASYGCHYCTDNNGEDVTTCSQCAKVTVTCDSTNNACEAGLCECDRIAVECFRSEEYHDQYKGLINLWNC